MPSRRNQSSKSSKPSGGGSSAPAGPVSEAGSPSTKDPAAMFAAALKETEARDKAQRERERQQREAAAQKAAAEQAHATALAQARRDLDRAIAEVRSAKSNGRSTVEADAAWKAAKARVIELETGAPPSWAPPAPVDESTDESVDGADTADAPVGDDSPGDAGAVGEEQS